jgi:ABC-type nitrate/sulfonate/bicarbonate transport system substrate-binding protein
MGLLVNLALIVSILVSAVARDAFCADASAKLTPLRIGIAARSATVMPLFVARERGFYREEGLDAQLILMKAEQTIQANIGGSIEFGSATGTAVSAAVNGAEVRVVLAVADRPTFDLISLPNIVNVDQLRGKKIGVPGIGSLNEILARRILAAHGLRPQEVTFLGMGPTHVTYAALKAGVIDATMLQIPLTFLAQDEGFHKLAYAGDTSRAVQGGLFSTKAIISQQPDLMSKTVRATLRAIRLILNDRKFGIQFIKGPFLDVGADRDRFAERIYDAMRQVFLETGIVDEQLQREMIADASQRIKPLQPVPPERVFDFSFVQKVSQSPR